MSGCPLWVPIPTLGTHTYPLWVPIPNLGTHTHPGYLIPTLGSKYPIPKKIKFLSNNINTLLTKKFIHIIIIIIFIIIVVIVPVQFLVPVQYLFLLILFHFKKLNNCQLDTIT
jgi:hypothetical protein